MTQRPLDAATFELILNIVKSGPDDAAKKLAAIEALLQLLDKPRDDRELQSVLNAVYIGAVKECEGREREGKLVGSGHHMAQHIVENVKAELIRRRLFGQAPEPAPAAPDDGNPSFRELIEKNRAEGGCGCAPGTILCPH